MNKCDKQRAILNRNTLQDKNSQNLMIHLPCFCARYDQHCKKNAVPCHSLLKGDKTYSVRNMMSVSMFTSLSFFLWPPFFISSEHFIFVKVFGHRGICATQPSFSKVCLENCQTWNWICGDASFAEWGGERAEIKLWMSFGN